MTEKRLSDDEISDLEDVTYTAIQIFKKRGIKVIDENGNDITERVGDLE